MDNFEDLASPRKRLKSQHPAVSQSMDDAAESQVEPMADTVLAHDQSATPPVDKEAECGITEYVDRHKPGFSAILKKRSERLVPIQVCSYPIW